MSEDVHRPRPVVDPHLPPPLREELLRGAEEGADPPLRWPSGETVTRSARLREGVIQLLAVGTALVLSLVVAGWYLGLFVAGVGLLAHSASLALRRDAHPAARAAAALTVATTAVAAPLWLLDALPPEPPLAVPWAVFGALVLLVTADTLTSGVQRSLRERLGEHTGRVVLPDDLGPSGCRLLAEVQRVVDRVEEAGREIGGDSLDTDRALAVLRDQEWRIASLLARQRELRRDHLRRRHKASSARVREALRPQREHLDAVEEAVRSRVAEITGYGDLVEQAVAAHREWEQCQEAADSTAEYAEHRASAAFLGTPSPEVGEVARSAEAARRVRDERVGLLAGYTLPAG